MYSQNIKLLSVILTLTSFSFSYGQDNPLNIYERKKTEIKDNLSDSIVHINGNADLFTQFNVATESNSSKFDNRFSLSFNIKYKGLAIPIQYIYSNGRTINSISGPNIRTPSFKNFGASPTFNNFTVYAGFRQMDFSKFTYSNTRFTGVGLEYAGENQNLKVFKGNLSYLNQDELNFLNNVEPQFQRKSFGILYDQKINKMKIGGVIFKASDKILPDIENIQSNPKENVCLEIYQSYSPNEKFDIKLSRTLSAYTFNSNNSRVDILEHSTLYNLLGLFQRKEGSTYKYANLGSIIYKLDNYSISLDYEEVDAGYRSLGVLNFDSNYRSISATLNGQFSEKTNSSVTIGTRSILDQTIQSPQNSSLLIRAQLSHKFSEKLFTNLNFSNINNTQRNYQRNFNRTSIDSISLFQANLSLGTNINYILNENGNSVISYFINYQKGNGIQEDSIQIFNVNKNFNTGANFRTALKLHELSCGLFFSSTRNSNFENSLLNLVFTDKVNINEQQHLSLNLGCSLLLDNGSSQSLRTSLTAEYSYDFKHDVTLSAQSNFELSNNNQRNENWEMSNGFISLRLKKGFNFKINTSYKKYLK